MLHCVVCDRSYRECACAPAARILVDKRAEDKRKMSCIGYHVDGGSALYASIRKAHSEGMGCVQSFITSPMRIFDGKLSQLREVNKVVADTGIKLIIHGPYVYNMASHDKMKFKQAHGMLKKLMEAASQAGATYVVNHVGSGDIDRVYEICEFVVKQSYSARLLLENDAGSKGKTRVGSIKNIMKLVKEIPEVGFCFDTAHAYAAGVDVELNGARIAQLMSPSVIHLNEPDAKVRLGSHLDRHNSVYGTGSLGTDVLVRIASQCHADTCIVVEASRDVAKQSIQILKTELGIS